MIRQIDILMTSPCLVLLSTVKRSWGGGGGGGWRLTVDRSTRQGHVISIPGCVLD